MPGLLWGLGGTRRRVGGERQSLARGFGWRISKTRLSSKTVMDHCQQLRKTVTIVLWILVKHSDWHFHATTIQLK